MTATVIPDQPQKPRKGDELVEVWLDLVTDDPATYGQPETRAWVLDRIPGLYQPGPAPDGTILDVTL